MDIDLKSTQEMLRIINAEDKIVADIVEKEISRIADAVELILKLRELRARKRLETAACAVVRSRLQVWRPPA